MGLRVVVVGIPGVGKTTVVEGLVSSFEGAKLANFGSVMLESALALKMVRHRDEIRKLPVAKQKRLQKLAAGRIARMRQSLVVVDTHLFIRTHEGYWPGLPLGVVAAMKPTHLILVEATPEEVATRRAADGSRYRDSVTVESLSEELTLARVFLTATSSLTGAPMKIVSNPQGKQDEVIAGLVDMLERATR